ncbi:hypothetical protein BGX34_002502 [Mortierella sp. NVP85]|nr:hypothetical protein BGX34_002502 [Mortierella sp. NVP85]
MLDFPGLSALLAWSRRLQHSQLLLKVFDLPELNDKIFSYLSMNDLVRWARVNKGWHHAVIPYIWNDLSTLTKSQYKGLARMVINDYQSDQCRTPKITGDYQSSLVKYCPLIRKLGLVSGQKFIFTPFLLDFILDDVMVEGVPFSDAQQATAQSIFHRFMVHCTSLRELEFTLRHYRFHEPVKVIADSAIQHLRHLSIHGTIRQWAFKYMMARFPVTLETLELGCQIHADSEHQLAMEIDETEQELLPSLRRLALKRGGYFHETFLSSLWRRCQSVEALDLITCGSGVYQSKENTMETFLETFFPNLNTVSIEEIYPMFNVKDEVSARLLSASRLGWRSVSIRGYVEFGEQSWEALSRHSATLENFTMVKRYYQDGVSLRPFFTSFPRLRSFVTLAETEEDYLKINAIDANDWIHQDSLSGSLTPWSCEYTLTDLRISICGIPRPDITHDRKGRKRHPVVEESYPGEGRMIQRRVYERLARFVNVEVLWLGSNSCYSKEPDMRSRKVMNHQYECLEMSLESGLDQLEGLKRLKVLNVSLMATKIGQREAQWVAGQWPKLHEIRGLENRANTWRARQWFKKNCPRIATP